MNKKLLVGGIYYNSARNAASIIFMTTSCECEELTLYYQWRFMSFQLQFLKKQEIQVWYGMVY